MTRISGPLSRLRSLSAALLGFAEDMLTREVAALRTPRFPLLSYSTSDDLDEACGRKPRAFGAMKESNTTRTGRAWQGDICDDKGAHN